MIESSHARTTAAAGALRATESLPRFATRLHDQEAALLRAVDEGTNLSVEFGAFVRSYLADDPFKDVREALLISHSLRRIFQSPELRLAAIDCTPYLDLVDYSDAPQAIVQALGTFAEQDRAVEEFLHSMIDRTVKGSLSLNYQAVNLARQIISCPEITTNQDILSKEESCRLVGIQL
jgi:hypothetical protein